MIHGESRNCYRARAWSIRHPGDSRRGFSDPDARVGRHGRGYDLGYKFHISLDHQRILPLAGVLAPANENEKRHGPTLVERTKQILRRAGAKLRCLIADSQYSSGRMRGLVDARARRQVRIVKELDDHSYNMTMGYWDGILRFHESISKDYPSGDNLSAVRFLKHFFEKLGCAGLPRDHPLNNRLLVGAETNYRWLIQYAKKLHTASSLSGFEEIVTRLTDQITFLNANNEIEVALKFHLAGLDVSFVPKETHKTPDILLKINKNEYHVEVSSLNPPDQEALMWMFHPRLVSLTFSKGFVSGGLINRIPNKKVLTEIVNQVKEKTEQIKITNESVKLNFPGYATIYIAPRDKMSEIPEGCRGMYTFAQPPRRPIEGKIRRKINEKDDQIFSSGKPVFLYTQTIDTEMLHEHFNKIADNVEVILASYPALLGLVLTIPHLRMDVVSSLSSDLLKRETKNNKVFLESEVGKYQYESSILWKNLHADQTFPLEILSAMENISSNLNNLLQLPSY